MKNTFSLPQFSQIISRKNLVKLLPIALFLVNFIWSDFFQSLPYFQEFLFFILIISGALSIRNNLKEKRQVELGEQYRIRNQFDSLSKIQLILLGAVLIASIIYFSQKIGLPELETVNYGLMGFLLLVMGIMHNYSIVLTEGKHSEISIEDKDFRIQSGDEKIEFSDYRITLTKANGKYQRLDNLDIDFKEAGKIKNWIESKLSASKITYYWNEADQIEKM